MANFIKINSIKSENKNTGNILIHSIREVFQIIFKVITNSRILFLNRSCFDTPHKKFRQMRYCSYVLLIWELPEAVTGGALWKKVFLKISQNSQKNVCRRVLFLIKLQVLSLNFAKFLRTPILKNICKRLLPNDLLYITCICHVVFAESIYLDARLNYFYCMKILGPIF